MSKTFCPKSKYLKCMKAPTCPKVPMTEDFNAPEGPYGFHYQPTYPCYEPKKPEETHNA